MRPTVLIIDDDPLIIKMVTLHLQREGYRVLSALNGLLGLKMARANSPDALLLDLMLPGIDGFEILTQLRAVPETADLPVVIMSAKSGLADIETANRIGADAYLTKPFRTGELLSILNGLMEGRQNQQAARGVAIGLVGARGGEAALLTLHLGLALVAKGQRTTVVDLHPFSIEHALLLDGIPSQGVVALADPDMPERLGNLVGRHSSGLRLLHSLEGRADGGQFTPQDVHLVLSTLLADEGLVLVDAPAYPVGVMRRVAEECVQVFLITHGDRAALGAAQAALTMMERASVDMEKVSLVFIGRQSTEGSAAALGRPVALTVPPGAGPEDLALQALADRLVAESRSSR